MGIKMNEKMGRCCPLPRDVDYWADLTPCFAIVGVHRIAVTHHAIIPCYAMPTDHPDARYPVLSCHTHIQPQPQTVPCLLGKKCQLCPLPAWMGWDEMGWDGGVKKRG